MPIPPLSSLRSSLLTLTPVAAVILVVHVLCGNGYGFHQDELQFLDDARHLHWGFAAYPPLTAFAGRLAISLFGISPQAFRLPSALGNALDMVLAGLLARELGGRLGAQATAALALLPLALALSTLMQYNTFDALAWTLLALALARLLRTGNLRWWLAAGAAIGLGVLSKYTIALPVVSVVAGVCLLPAQRCHLRVRWFWLGGLVAFAIASPNLYWLATHHFLTLQMEHHIHLRDVRIGRGRGYFIDQLRFTLFAFPLACAGLIALLRSPRFRLLSALYLGPFLLLALMHGRGYYLLPGYAVLYAAGAVSLEQALGRVQTSRRRLLQAGVVACLLLDTAVQGVYFVPIFREGSRLWLWQMRANDDMPRELGWPQVAAQVARIRDSLLPAEKNSLAVVAEDYSTAGALALYGPRYGLPVPISTVNSFYARGWGSGSPQTVIVVGGERDDLARFFLHCRLAGTLTLPWGVENDVTRYEPDIFVCTGTRMPWPQLWALAGQQFG